MLKVAPLPVNYLATSKLSNASPNIVFTPPPPSGAAGSKMPSYVPFHWQSDSTSSLWKSGKSSSRGNNNNLHHPSPDILWPENLHKNSPWTALDFPWDKGAILDDRNIPWQHHHSNSSSVTTWNNEPLCPSHESSNFVSLSNSGYHNNNNLSTQILTTDLTLNLDPNQLVLGTSPFLKYQPLRESPTPPKPKKRLIAKKSNNGGDEPASSLKISPAAPSLNNNNSHEPSISSKKTKISSTNNTVPLSNQCDVHEHQQKVLGTVSGAVASNNVVPNGSSNRRNSASNTPTPPPKLGIDPVAFERYYEGSLLGDHCCTPLAGPSRGTASNPQRSSEGVCGGLGPLSLALALPGKLEGLLKLLAQSLHLVLAGFCSRCVNSSLTTG